VVAEFPDGDLKNRMNNALPSLRLPYWDAAAVPPIGEGSYPWCVQRKTIEVELPDGGSTKRVMIPNPLYAYTFHPLPIESFRNQPANSTKAPERWLEWASTKRFPTSWNASAQSQDEQIAFHLDWNSENFRQRTYFMLAIQNDYYNFSNNMVRINDPEHGGVLDSLESVHDTLHNAVGEGGHMTLLEYSAFDPIFWLLHGYV
jgi:tyrosinase